MPTLHEAVKIAAKVYTPSTADAPGIEGWVCPGAMVVNDTSVFQGGSMFTSGLQGRVFKKVRGNEVVFAFKGTVPTMMSDITADLAIVLNRAPGQARDARMYAERWRRAYPDAKITLVGHSLGGGICQLVGTALDIKFVTFNAPGMLEAARGISPFFSGVGRIMRALGGGMPEAGVNYRRSWDLVGNFGAPIGRRVEIAGGSTGPLASHSIDPFVEVIRSHPWRDRDALA